MDYAQECLGLAEEAVSKSAALTEELQRKQSKQEELILTKVAKQLPSQRVEKTVDRLIDTSFVKRANRKDAIEGIQSASREELFAILEKLASIAICPVTSILEEDGEVVEKAAGESAHASDKDDVWSTTWKQVRAEGTRLS